MSPETAPNNKFTSLETERLLDLKGKIDAELDSRESADNAPAAGTPWDPWVCFVILAEGYRGRGMQTCGAVTPIAVDLGRTFGRSPASISQRVAEFAHLAHRNDPAPPPWPADRKLPTAVRAAWDVCRGLTDDEFAGLVTFAWSHCARVGLIYDSDAAATIRGQTADSGSLGERDACAPPGALMSEPEARVAPGGHAAARPGQ